MTFPFLELSEQEAYQTSMVELYAKIVNRFSVNFIKWSNTLKKFVGNFPTNCLSVFDHFVGLALKGLPSKSLTISPKSSITDV